MIKIYRKTTTIKAEQFDGSKKMIKKYAHPLPKNVPEPSSNSWVTKNGLFEFHIGDWFISKPDGIYGPINNADFKRDNAELPVIPQVIADYIEKCKHQHRSLASALMEIGMPTDVQDYFRNYQSTERWIWLQDNFARAWLDGYQVEEEK